MLGTLMRAPGKTLGAIALVVAATGFLIPNAGGVTPGSQARDGTARVPDKRSAEGRGRALTRVIRVQRDFTVDPHSLAINQLLACPADTQLVGGGTTLNGEPSDPSTAPVVYTNGPVGDLLPDSEQTWASEVANDSDETFEYRQFALCVQSKPKDKD